MRLSGLRESIGTFLKEGKNKKVHTPEEKHDGDHPPTQEHGHGISRRDVLKMAGAGATALAARKAEQLLNPFNHESKKDSKESNNSLFEGINISTAAASTAMFFRWVKKCKEGSASFGPASIIELNLVNAARREALKWGGGKEGQELAKHEEHALLEGYAITIPLVVAADFASQAIKINADSIFGQAAEVGAAQSERGLLPARPQRGLDAREATEYKREWAEHLEKVNEQLVEQTAQLLGLTEVLAPFLTTYVSSGAADQLKNAFNEKKKSVLSLLFEQSYARHALTACGQERDDERMQRNSVERANKLMENFEQMVVTLSCNTQGSSLVGDPPKIVAYAQNLNNPKRLAQIEAAGIINSQLASHTIAASWLNEAGIGDKSISGTTTVSPIDFGGKFLEAEKKTLQALRGITTGEVDTSSFKELVGALKDMGKNEDGFAKVGEALGRLKRPGIEVSIGAWIDSKLDGLRNIENIGFQKLVSPLLGQKLPEAITPEIIAAASQTGDAGSLARLMKLHLEMSSGEISQELLSLQQDIARTQVTAAAEDESDTSSKDHQGTIDRITRQVQDLRSSMPFVLSPAERALQEKNEPQRSDELKKLEEEILQLLIEKRILHEQPHTLTATLAQIGEISEPHLKMAVEKFLTLKERAEGSERKETEKHFLSPAAQEVAYALGSQMPCVEPMAETVKWSLLKALETTKDALPTRLSKMIAAATAVFTSEAAISAYADNVAAFLYGQKVLSDLAIELYGKDVLKNNPAIEDAIVTSSLLLAMQAGSLTLLGNGPNFLQENCRLRVEDGKLDTVITRPTVQGLLKNKYSVALNGATIGISIGMLFAAFQELEHAPKHEPKPPAVQTREPNTVTRTALFDKFRRAKPNKEKKS